MEPSNLSQLLPPLSGRAESRGAGRPCCSGRSGRAAAVAVGWKRLLTVWPEPEIAPGRQRNHAKDEIVLTVPEANAVGDVGAEPLIEAPAPVAKAAPSIALYQPSPLPVRKRAVMQRL